MVAMGEEYLIASIFFFLDEIVASILYMKGLDKDGD